MYAVLKNASVECPACGASAENDWQFHYGSYTDLPEYRLGDEILWGKQTFYESLPNSELFAIAYPGREFACNHCKKPNFLALIHIVENVIKSVEFYKDEAWVPERILGPDKSQVDE